MPTFDRDNLPDEVTVELLDAANAGVESFRVRKSPSIALKDPITSYRQANLIRVYIQAHIRRCLAYIDGGLAEYKAGRSLVTYSCARSIYEDVAVICDF